MNRTILNLTDIPVGTCRQLFLDSGIYYHNITILSPKEDPRDSAEETGFLLGFFIFVLFIGLSKYFDYKSNKAAKKKALETSVITDKPWIPEWARGLHVQWIRKYSIECRDYTPKYIADTFSRGEKPQEAILWIQKILKDVRIPKTARIISVPMANFKTGRYCTEFVPLSGMAPGSRLSYQICGDFKFQVTRYVENGVAYVAGYCMYIEEPYEEAKWLEKCHIENCENAIPKYQLKGPVIPEESAASGILENLKLIFCKVLRKPVMIGSDNGVIKHFKWHGSYFLVSECPKCCLERLEGNPPPYHSVISL